MKLYVKVKCTFCLGTRVRYPYNFCPYCGVEGTTYLEASYKAVKEYIFELSEKDRKELRKILNEDNDREKETK